MPKRPQFIQDARHERNVPLLSRAGKKGAEALAKKRADEREQAEMAADAHLRDNATRQKEEWERKVSANEHIIPLETYD